MGYKSSGFSDPFIYSSWAQYKNMPHKAELKTVQELLLFCYPAVWCWHELLQLKPWECSLHTGEACTALFYQPRCLFSSGFSPDSSQNTHNAFWHSSQLSLGHALEHGSCWNWNPKTHRENKEIKGLKVPPWLCPHLYKYCSPGVRTPRQQLLGCNKLHLLTGKGIFWSIFSSPDLLPAFPAASLPAHLGRDRDQSSASPKAEYPPYLQLSHSLCTGTGHKLLHMLMSSVRHNPQTSGTSLEQCPCKIKSLTNSNQYFHYCIKLALFCFTSNPNCFLSTNWPAQGSDLNTICHCLPKPNQLTCLSLSTPGQGTESCHGFASSKPQNNIFNTVEPDRFLCWGSLPWQSLISGIQNTALWIRELSVSLGLFP